MSKKLNLVVIVGVMLMSALAYSKNLTSLGETPNWGDLEEHQHTMTVDQFRYLLDTVYAQGGAWSDTIKIRSDHAMILKEGKTAQKEYYKLYFSGDPISPKDTPKYWRHPSEMAVLNYRSPLDGVKIALDPGHIGGEFSVMEGRHFRIGKDKAVKEGEIALKVAQILKEKLESQGAQVMLTRDKNAPVTKKRPEDFMAKAQSVSKEGASQGSVKRTSEVLFYVVSETRERAKKVNNEFKPDLAICLHFNADVWPDPNKPSLTEKSHSHILINGAYSREELAYDDLRHEMLIKLLTKSSLVERDVARALANSMEREMHLPPYVYKGTNAFMNLDTPYVWTRNLLANRVFLCPVVYLEPYVANSKEDYERIQMGTYSGTRVINGVNRKDIFNEYADSVVSGLTRYFSKARKYRNTYASIYQMADDATG